jgi:hypothetical protein
MNEMPILAAVNKYYTQLEDMVNELASKCVGGEEVTVAFTAGKVTIKLK